MSESYQIKCPCCRTILVVEKKSGAILEERRPILDDEKSTGDRYEDALKKVRERGSVAEDKYKKFQAGQSEKMARLDALFKDKVREAEEGGPIERFNPLDND
jgi:hypothetical protein